MLFFVFWSLFWWLSRNSDVSPKLRGLHSSIFFFFFFNSENTLEMSQENLFCSQTSTSFRFHPDQRQYFAVWSHVFSRACSSPKGIRGKWWGDDCERSLPPSTILWFCENWLIMKLTESSKIQVVWILDRRWICGIFWFEHCHHLLIKCSTYFWTNNYPHSVCSWSLCLVLFDSLTPVSPTCSCSSLYLVGGRVKSAVLLLP